MGIGTNVRKLRYAKGISVKDLARAAGISRTTLWQIERGKVEAPRATTAMKLSLALGVSASEIMGAPTVSDVVPTTFATLEAALAHLDGLEAAAPLDLASAAPIVPEQLPPASEVARYLAIFDHHEGLGLADIAKREDFPAGVPIDPARLRWDARYHGYFHVPNADQ